MIDGKGFITTTGLNWLRSRQSNVTLVAYWKPNIINISYDSNGGAPVPSTTCEYNSTVTLATAPSNSGKEFSAWLLNNNTYAADATISCNYATLGVYSGTVTATAQWDTCPANSFCPSGGTPQSCPVDYPNSDAGATSVGNCYLVTTPGHYVKTANAAEELCESGAYFCPGNQRVYYDRTGGSFPCPTNYYTYGDTAADHDSLSDCLISCDGGSYLANANDTTCTNVGAGYWAANSMVNYGSAGSRTPCKNGWTTIGYGFGANEEDDCGRIFNYGSEKIYLRSAKRGDASQPALHVKIGDVIFYGTMKQVTGPQSGFNAEYDGKNYLIVNDDQ